VRSVGTRCASHAAWRAWERAPHTPRKPRWKSNTHSRIPLTPLGNAGSTHAQHGRHYAHSGSMHQDGRRCMEVGTSNKWYTETASKQPAAHPPERPQNPAIQLITAAAHPPERPQKPRNPPHHRRGPSPTAKRGTSCAAAQLARPGRHNQCSASASCEKRQLAIAKTWQER
jgi:hypothetical protein